MVKSENTKKTATKKRDRIKIPPLVNCFVVNHCSTHMSGSTPHRVTKLPTKKNTFQIPKNIEFSRFYFFVISVFQRKNVSRG